MSADTRASDSLPRRFLATRGDRRRWRRAMEWSHTECIYLLLKTVESDLIERMRRAPEMGVVTCVREDMVAEASMPSGGALHLTWLVKYRANFRWVAYFGKIEPIKLYVADCPAAVRPVAIWLWGRCADRFRLYGLSAFVHDPSPRVRREVAKALRRLEAWALLDEMAAAHPEDEKVQWFASAQTTHRAFVERLKSFTADVDRSRAKEAALASQMPFWAEEGKWERTGPKSVAYLRRMLLRIRRWVRGSDEVTRAPGQTGR